MKSSNHLDQQQDIYFEGQKVKFVYWGTLVDFDRVLIDLGKGPVTVDYTRLSNEANGHLSKEALETKVKRLYPDCTDIKIVSVFRPGTGWVDCLAQPLSKNALEHLKDTGATHVNLSLIDEYGETRRPDYTVAELLTEF